VFIDSDTDSWNMNPELLGRALESAAAAGRVPKAVVVVDLYGQCADYREIEPLCDSYGVVILEDAAEAVGASCHGRPAGAFGNIGTLSFNGNKIMTTSGGGALLTDDEDTAARARYLSTQARQSAVHYQHTEIGYNYRLSNLLAAVGCAQLERLDEMSTRRRRINEMYRSALADAPLSFMPVPDWSCWNGWLTCVCFESSVARDRVMNALENANIESRPLWKPLHLQPAFSGCDAHVDGTSERLFEIGLCLPSGSALSDSDIKRTAKLVMSAVC
jgi:dTDP-4-amino-4,6-dideoxygalactose transaminase